jgi:Chromo (CHRromatin Organisation MOdifier) domain
MLEPHYKSNILDRLEPPPAPVEIDGDLEFEVQEILDSKLNLQRMSCPLMYQVKWLGYDNTDESDSWLSARDLENAPDAIQVFHKHHPDKPGPLKTLPPISVLRAQRKW